MGYYTGNAVYNAIENSPFKNNFRWAIGDSWLLVYGDNQSKPKVLVYVKAIPGNPLDYKHSDLDLDLINILESLAKPLHLPVIEIRFNSRSRLRRVAISQLQDDLKFISLEELVEVFTSFGISISDRRVVKEINKASSSSYHDWQRKVLGDSITVSDIDLIRVRDDTPIEIVEAKRSYIEVENWEPFKVDYPNFRLIWEISMSNHLPMTILYNQRRKNPFIDDVSRVSIFSLDFKRLDTIWKKLGMFRLDQFLCGEYLTRNIV